MFQTLNAANETGGQRLSSRTRDAFAQAERQGLMMAAAVRTAALLAILLWLALDSPESGATYIYSLFEVLLFSALGVLQYLAAKIRSDIQALKYIFVTVDCILMAVIFLAQDPFSDLKIPPAVIMSGSQFTFFYLILMQAAFSLRPSLVLWCGLWIVLARTSMLVWLLNQPGVYSNLDLSEKTVEALIEARRDDNFLFLGFWAQEVITVILVSIGLAAVVRRSYRLVETRARAERSRASLARYFSPNVVDRLSHTGAGIGTAREQHVAVLFADVMGFTALCESESPEAVIALLREYHDRLGKAVFENGGTLDKYIGDGLMATFGTPDPGPQDAAHALTCAFAMLDALSQWNDERDAKGLAMVRVGIGVHYGPVIAGDIGNRRRLEYSVIGDTVNIASRLESLTRQMESPLVVSRNLVDAIGGTDEREATLLSRLKAAGKQAVKGRQGSIEILTLASGAPPEFVSGGTDT